jgi:hypothetical protein
MPGAAPHADDPVDPWLAVLRSSYCMIDLVGRSLRALVAISA